MALAVRTKGHAQPLRAGFLLQHRTAGRARRGRSSSGPVTLVSARSTAACWRAADAASRSPSPLSPPLRHRQSRTATPAAQE